MVKYVFFQNILMISCVVNIRILNEESIRTLLYPSFFLKTQVSHCLQKRTLVDIELPFFSFLPVIP